MVIWLVFLCFQNVEVRWCFVLELHMRPFRHIQPCLTFSSECHFSFSLKEALIKQPQGLGIIAGLCTNIWCFRETHSKSWFWKHNGRDEKVFVKNSQVSLQRLGTVLLVFNPSPFLFFVTRFSAVLPYTITFFFTWEGREEVLLIV